MISYLGYLAVNVVGFIIRQLPLAVALWVGRRLGELNYLLNNKRRKISYSNLKAAFAKEKGPQELARINRAVFRNLGQNLVEVLRFPRLTTHDIERLMKFVGLERLDEALSGGKGAILLSAHLGNWEFSLVAMAAKGYPANVIAKAQPHTRLNRLLNSYRESKGGKVITRGMGIRELIRGLGQNQIVGILEDEDAKSFGSQVNFFDRKVTARGGAISLAMKAGCEILPAFMIREKGGRHRLVVAPRLELERSGDEAKDIQSGLQRFTSVLESYIRRYPEQWFWLQRRWKSSPDRSILILSDGKAGHLRQSLAAAKVADGRWQAQDGGWRDTRYKVVEPRYKNSFFRFLLILMTFFASSRCQGCLRCLKICLEPSSYEELKREFCNLIISAGSSLAPVNLVLAKENMAKSVVMMKPGPFSTRRFDLAIIPRHDLRKGRRNILITRASPNLISEGHIRQEAEKLKQRINLTRDLRIALFIGGDNPHYRLTDTRMGQVLDNLIRAAKELDAEMLVTTSRRTPTTVCDLVKKRLGQEERCRLLVITSEANIEGAVEGMLGLAQIAIVSQDSIAMVSEAASSGRYVIVFELDRVGGRLPKHGRFVSELATEGYVVTSSSDRLYEAVTQIWDERPPIRALDDNEIVKERIRALL